MRWWIDESVLMGCHNPTDRELVRLIDGGVATVISLLDEEAQSPSYGATHFGDGKCTRISIPVPDYGIPTTGQIETFIRIVGERKGYGTVLVHCQGGSGRTGTMGALWLIMVRGFSPDEAVRAVRSGNPSAIETGEQERLVLSAGEAP